MNRRPRKQKPVAEINITPFTDVILVLLIIFMIATPLMSQTTSKVNPLKAKKAKAAAPAADTPKINIIIDQAGTIFLEKEAVTIDELSESLADMHKNNPSVHVLLRADSVTQYRYIARVLDVLNDTDIKNINIAVETDNT
jgi:biopolymer transport protein TolR